MKKYSKTTIIADKIRSSLVRLAFPEYHSKIELECSNVSPNNKLVNSYFYSMHEKVNPGNKLTNCDIIVEDIIKEEIKSYSNLMHKEVLGMTMQGFLYKSHDLNHPIYQHGAVYNNLVQDRILALINMKKLKFDEKDTLAKVMESL